MLTEQTINYDADTIEDAMTYMEYRNKQLLKFGFDVTGEIIHRGCAIVTYYNSKYNDELYFGSIFLLKSYRGRGLYKKIVDEFKIAVLTLEECNIEGYLNYKSIPNLVLKHSPSYKLIQNIYSCNKTKRTSIPFIYHIDEGGGYLDKIGASDICKDAYYLHPIFQNDNDFNNNKSLNLDGINTESIILAIEYRRVANSYLSHMSVESFVGFTCVEIKQMLIADKVQNYKDFMKYHYGKHKRSSELYEYFHNWFRLLQINYNDYV